MEMEYEPTVFIIEDCAFLCGALRLLFGSIHLRAESYRAAEDFLEHYRPELQGCLIVDVRLPGGLSGLELLEILHDQHSHLPVIVTTAHADVSMAVRAMHARAFDFLEKPVNNQVLLERVRQALEQDKKQHAKHIYHNNVCQRMKKLTVREHQVMLLLIEGKVTKQIANSLNIKTKTVETYRASVFEKMRANNPVELVNMLSSCEAVTLPQPDIKPEADDN